MIIPGLTRAQIKEKEKQENKDPNENASLLKKSSPAKLLARVFGIDVSKCTNCGGRMKITSSIFVIPRVKRGSGDRLTLLCRGDDGFFS